MSGLRLARSTAPGPLSRALRPLAALLCLALLIWSGAARAELPAPLTSYINDYDNRLSALEEAALTERLRSLRRETGIHVVIATFADRSLAGPYGSVADLGLALFNHWGIGDPQRNDGILLLAETGPREIRITLGSGYPPVWDNRAQRVIDLLVSPPLTEGRFAEGFHAGITGIGDYIARPFAAGQSFEGTEGMPEPENGSDLYVFLAAIAGILALAAWGAIESIKDRFPRLITCPNCGRRDIRVTQIPDPLQNTREVIRRCGSCNWQESRSESTESRRREDDGSDGYGGGSSSGGGASGRY